ncbi:MAG: acyl-CoA dehydrogenase family protein [Chloroflexi bacterium]|nr:acyl-CoA dehydrogenase family protein [Chloroflexota bacterium]
MNSSQTREGEALIEAARALRPQIERYAAQIEEDRQLPQPLVDALAQAGLFKMLVPQSLGGSETDPETFCRVIEELSRVDGSTGWSVFVPACVGAASGSFGEDVAWEIFGREPKACIASSVTPAPNSSLRPPDRAIVVDGGYRVTGRWSFTSGCMHSTWLAGASGIYEGDKPKIDDKGQPEVRLMLFPISDCQIIDTWRVTGLRGSGSHDFAVTDVFVPHEHSLSRSTPVKPCHPGALYVFAGGKVTTSIGTAGPVIYSHWTVVGSIGFAAVCLGIARGALDALTELAAVKTLGKGKGQLRDNPIVQDQVGRAEATLQAARAYMYAMIREVWETVHKSGSSTPEQLSLLRLTATHAATLSAQVVDTAWNTAGASAIFAGNPIERRFRDIHVATQNIAIRSEYYAVAGRMFLGLDKE